MKITVTQNGTAKFENFVTEVNIEAEDILNLVKHCIAEEEKRRAERNAERRMETSTFEVPLGKKPRA
jgi:hypothetical protein